MGEKTAFLKQVQTETEFICLFSLCIL